jgi:phosphatidylinositol 4-kinase
MPSVTHISQKPVNICLDFKVPNSPLGSWRPDRSRLFARELSSHSHFTGEASGVRLANRIGEWKNRLHSCETFIELCLANGDLEKVAPSTLPVNEIMALKSILDKTLTDIQEKISKLSSHDFRRLLFRTASVLMSYESVRCGIGSASL